MSPTEELIELFEKAFRLPSIDAKVKKPKDPHYLLRRAYG